MHKFSIIFRNYNFLAIKKVIVLKQLPLIHYKDIPK